MFRIDSKTKKAAQRRAKAQGIALSDLFQSTARDFAEGKITFSVKREEENWQNKSKRNLFEFYGGRDDIYDSI